MFGRCAVRGRRAYGFPGTSTRASSRAGSSPCSPRRSAATTRSAAPRSSRLRSPRRRRRSLRRLCRGTTRRPRGLDPLTISPPRFTGLSRYLRRAPRGASRRRCAGLTARLPRGRCTRRRSARRRLFLARHTTERAPCCQRRQSCRGWSGGWRRLTRWRGRVWTSRSWSWRTRGGVWTRRTRPALARFSAGR